MDNDPMVLSARIKKGVSYWQSHPDDFSERIDEFAKICLSFIKQIKEGRRLEETWNNLQEKKEESREKPVVCARCRGRFPKSELKKYNMGKFGDQLLCASCYNGRKKKRGGEKYEDSR